MKKSKSFILSLAAILLISSPIIFAGEHGGTAVDGDVDTGKMEQEWGRILVGLHKLEMEQPEDSKAINVALSEVNSHFMALILPGGGCPAEESAYCLHELEADISKKIYELPESQKNVDKGAGLIILRIIGGILRPSELGDGTHDGQGNRS